MDMLNEIIVVSRVVEDISYLEPPQISEIIKVRVEFESSQDISCNNDEKRKAFYEKKLARLKLIQDICK
jgi:hypothetical protein